MDGASGRDGAAVIRWDRVRGQLKREFGETAFRTWVQPMTLAQIGPGSVRLGVPTRFMRDWVMTHYGDRIRSLWTEEDPSVRIVDFVVEGSARPTKPAAGAGSAGPIVSQPAFEEPSSPPAPHGPCPSSPGPALTPQSRGAPRLGADTGRPAPAPDSG
ncbi:DnaA N-terminal domain-containing protein [Pararhodospirillum photometricum]|uniref:DnaA N-terminal domain-containing protein n=1 Tax=Pararhodospirillum photometricum TaxID=1084 RepID=UPI0002D746F5|nr:DnaA N-terminal domain-containing protein [Pararhodospirillum photometricum]